MGARSRNGAVGAVLLLVLGCARAIAQGFVETDDGLRLSLSAGGRVTGLSVDGVAYASDSVPSGFAYRELPVAPVDAAPNGSFESGAGGPASWSWSNNSSGSWFWDASVAFAGSRSLRVEVPGAMARRGPTLLSNSFPIEPNSPYTLTCQVRTSEISSYLDVYVVERDAAGNSIQHGVVSRSGTTDWHERALTFISSPRAESASFKVVLSDGFGTAWLDEVRLLDLFGGKAATPIGGSVSSEGGGVLQTFATDGLEFEARFTGGPTAVRVDATLADLTGRDRAIELTFRLPLDLAGGTWDDDFITPMAIATGTRFEKLDTGFGGQTQGHTHSVYPFATVRNNAAAFSLASPMGPLMYRLSYDDVDGFRITYDLGLSPATTKNPSRATVSFWIYTQDPKWGMRSAAEKYYTLNLRSFTTSANKLGAWVLGNSLPISSVPEPLDFGWAYHEQSNELAFDNANGVLALHYVNPSSWGLDLTQHAGQPRPPYDTLITALEAELDTTRLTEDGVPASRMARSVFDTAPHDENGLQQLDYNGFFWKSRGLQNYPMLPDPDIPGSRYGIVKQYSVDGRIAAAQNAGRTLNGIFLDNIGLTYANVESYRRSLWAYLDTPLSFSYATRLPTAYSGDAMAKFCAALREYLHGKGMILMASSSAFSYSWFAHVVDVVGGEAQGADPLDRAYARRALSYGKPWSNLYVPAGGVPPTAADVLAYLRQALLLGYFPGFNGIYWDNPAAYERDRSLFQQYVPLIRIVTEAGWQPIPGVVSSEPAILVERFDDQRGDVFYLTAQNSAAAQRAFQLTLQADRLGIAGESLQVRELLRDRALSAFRVDGNHRFADTLAPGETFVYEIRAPRISAPERGRPRRIEPRN